MPERRLAILLVDGQALDRRALMRFIEAEGLPYDVVGTGSLAEAGTQLGRRSFDVAIVDQRLGDGVGVDLLPSLLGTPAIILTRPGDETIAAQAVRAGAYGFLVRDAGRRYLHLLSPTVSSALARRRAEIAASARAEDLARTRSEFQQVVTMMWHEVMGPLTTLLSTLEMIQIDGEANPASLPPDVVVMIQQLVEIATGLERLITDVLGYYRLHTAPALVPVDLDALVAETIASLPLSVWHDALVEKDRLPCTSGDPTRLRLLFRQLLDHIQAFRSAEPFVVHVAASEYPDAVRITLSDNGVGCTPGDGDCLTSRGDPAMDGPAGLRLAICTRIVEQHGGRLWFESGRDGGTAVHVTLPKAQALCAGAQP
jgi:signal transduction histidine kinase